MIHGFNKDTKERAEVYTKDEVYNKSEVPHNTESASDTYVYATDYAKIGVGGVNGVDDKQYSFRASEDSPSLYDVTNSQMLWKGYTDLNPPKVRDIAGLLILERTFTSVSAQSHTNYAPFTVDENSSYVVYPQLTEAVDMSKYMLVSVMRTRYDGWVNDTEIDSGVAYPSVYILDSAQGASSGSHGKVSINVYNPNTAAADITVRAVFLKVFN